jgi:hypothetical protein
MLAVIIFLPRSQDPAMANRTTLKAHQILDPPGAARVYHHQSQQTTLHPRWLLAIDMSASEKVETL